MIHLFLIFMAWWLWIPQVIFYGAFMAPARGEVALVFERMEGPTLDLFVLAGRGRRGIPQFTGRMVISVMIYV